MAAAFADGTVTAEQLTAAAVVVTPEHLTAAAAQGVDLAEVDTALMQVATARPYDELRQVVQHYLGCLDPDGPEPDPTEGRLLTAVRHDDGRVSGRFELDPVGGEKLLAGVESIVQANRPEGDDRTRAQRQADALVQLLDNQLAASTLPFLRRVKPQVFLMMNPADLLDPHTVPAAAQTGFGAQLSAARARGAICDGSLTRVVLDPETRSMNVGRTQRIFPPHIR